MKILCKEKPRFMLGQSFYSCGGGETINGIRYCSSYAQKMQIDYAGHLFCADIGDKIDESQISLLEEL